MDIGKLNKRVRFQRASATQDDLGESDTSFAPYYSCWASIDASNSPQIYATDEFVSRPIMRVTIRWTSSVIFQSGDQVTYTQGSTGIVHTYEIQSFVNTAQADRELVILAYEINPQE